MPASICVEPEIREHLTYLIASRKLANVCSRKPCSVVGIVDAAILTLAMKMKTKSAINFVPVPAMSSVRVSLRMGSAAHRAAQIAAREANIRISDIIRTGLILYLHKHDKEIGSRLSTRCR